MIKFFQKLKAKKGFTLVELIVVIAIIGVLAAILVPTMLNYVTSSRVTSADSTAASIKNNIDTFLTNADTAGYGMLKGNTNVAKIGISITGGEWSMPLFSAKVTSFKSGAGKNWSATMANSYETGDSKVSEDSARALLLIELADLFPEIEDGYIGAALQGGKCTAVYYTADSTASDSQMNILLSTGASFAGFSSDVCAWDNTTAGVSASGLIVGTAPKVGLGE